MTVAAPLDSAPDPDVRMTIRGIALKEACDDLVEALMFGSSVDRYIICIGWCHRHNPNWLDFVEHNASDYRNLRF